eukprot:UN34894
MQGNKMIVSPSESGTTIENFIIQSFAMYEECPPGWSVLSSSKLEYECYQYFGFASLEFYTARAYCNSFGSDFVSDLNSEVTQELSNARESDSLDPWIGLKNDENGQWTWVDGSANTENWSSDPALLP